MTEPPTPSSVTAPSLIDPTLQDLLQVFSRAGVSCEIRLPDGGALHTGSQPPAFSLFLRSRDALSGGLSERAIGEAYLACKLDIEGDLLAAMDVRDQLEDALDWRTALRMLARSVARKRTRINRDAIAAHYQLGDDFYLTFLDQASRFYSQCLFSDDDLSLEDAALSKLEAIEETLQLRPGMRLLDIGGGWGGIEEHFGKKGVRVTALTIAEDSRAYISRLVERGNLPVEVRLEDVFDHFPDEPYDAAVMLGVIEHVPQYRRFAEHLWTLLKPDARLYLDASATVRKYDISAFTRRYIWPGPHTFLCVQDLVEELLYHGHDVLEVRNESHDYELTMRHWAHRYDAHREAIASRWGEPTYRAFRLYLWAGAHALHNDRLQAYRVVTRRRSDSGERPGRVRRTAQFLRDLF